MPTYHDYARPVRPVLAAGAAFHRIQVVVDVVLYARDVPRVVAGAVDEIRVQEQGYVLLDAERSAVGVHKLRPPFAGLHLEHAQKSEALQLIKYKAI